MGRKNLKLLVLNGLPARTSGWLESCPGKLIETDPVNITNQLIDQRERSGVKVASVVLSVLEPVRRLSTKSKIILYSNLHI